MQAKEFLNQPFNLNNKIHDKTVLLDYYRDILESISSPGLEEKYVSNPNTKASFELYLTRIDELEHEINDDYKELEELKNEVSTVIVEIMEPKEQMILYNRYIKFMKISEIAEEMDFSLSWTKKLHRRALENFEKRYPKDTHKPLYRHT